MKAWSKDDQLCVNEEMAAVCRDVVKVAGLSVTEVAARSGYSIGHVSNLLRGEGAGQMPVAFVVALVRMTGQREPLEKLAVLATTAQKVVTTAAEVMQAMAEAASLAGAAEQVVTAAMADGVLSPTEAQSGDVAVGRAMRGFRRWAAELAAAVRLRRGVRFADC